MCVPLRFGAAGHCNTCVLLQVGLLRRKTDIVHLVLLHYH